ncbi:Ribosome-binding ATPase YchF [Balamuthia mandrillaris]
MKMSSGRLHSVLFCDRSASASAVSSMVLRRRYSSVPRGGSAFSLAPPLSVFNFFLRHHYAPRRGYAAASSSSSAAAEKSALSFFSSKSTCRAVGIVGMPNVGKSTLFNALTSSQAAKAANFPFCTIDPNIGKIWVPDERLEKLAQLARSEKITPAQMEFVDIAGLVAGASQGAGLGNKFLANIREVSMILQVVRCFENGGMGEEIAHVEGTIDPIRDIETINTELQLADIDTLQKALSKKTKANDEAGKKRLELIEKTLDILDKGQNAYTITLTEDEWPIFSAFHLLTAKPVLYCCNVRVRRFSDSFSSFSFFFYSNPK